MVIRHAARYLVIFGVILGAVGLLYQRLPTSFLPNEDQGYLLVNVQLPPGATAERLETVMQSVEAYLGEQAEVEFYNVVRGAAGRAPRRNRRFRSMTCRRPARPRRR